MALLQPKNPISTIFGPRTAQKRLSNGYRNGWGTIERAASTFPSGNERPWEVSFASGQASRRVSRARVVVPLGRGPGRSQNIVATPRTQIPKLTICRRVWKSGVHSSFMPIMGYH
jgi:hypothetical protein